MAHEKIESDRQVDQEIKTFEARLKEKFSPLRWRSTKKHFQLNNMDYIKFL